MAAWDIDPGGVATVVAATRGVAAAMNAEAARIRGGVDSAAAVSGSGLVRAALTDFVAGQARHFDDVSTRADSCVTAATRATEAYVGGDEQMAARAQAAARTVPELLSLMGPP